MPLSFARREKDFLNRESWIVAYRVIVGGEALLAIGYRFLISWSIDPYFHVVNFWNFFTNQSNVLAPSNRPDRDVLRLAD
jgi:hypothetical protein